MFEYREDTKNTPKTPFNKKKARIITLKNKMLTKNISDLNNSRNNKGGLTSQNSYEYFQTKKKEKLLKKK